MKDLAAYRSRYDVEVDLKKALHAVGGNDAHEYWAQPAFMMSRGLRPHHTFLDLGCGCLRGTALLVAYVNEGNFYGADVSKSFLSKSQERLDELKITRKPNLFHVENFDLFNILKYKFDYVLAVSLLTHILPKDLPDLFRGVSDVLHKTGEFYFTIYPVEGKLYAGDMECMYYNKDYLIDIGYKSGLKIEDIPGKYPNPCKNFIKRVNTPMLGQWVMKAKLL